MDINDTNRPVSDTSDTDLAAKVAKLERQAALVDQLLHLVLEIVPTSWILRELADRTDVAEEESS